MRLVTSAKVLALVGLACLSSATTSHLLGRSREAQTIPHSDRPVSERSERLPNPRSLPNGTGPQGTLVAEFSLLTMALAPEPDGVGVFVAAEITDRRPNVRYLWRVATSGPDDTVIDDRWYIDQLFTKVLETELVTLDDFLDLGPGTYNLVVRLYEFREGTDIPQAVVNEAGLRDQHLVLQRSQRVTVAE